MDKRQVSVKRIVTQLNDRKSSLFVNIFSLFVVSLLFWGCSNQTDTPFKLLPPSQTGIYFTNELEKSPDLNIRNFLYFYNGGGVAVGDLNNNGLPDLFFTANTSDNKLYENLGDFRFEDITDRAGIIDDDGSWSTGVTMADVNGNGYLDIYVNRVNYLTKSGANQLFINNGDMTFTEQAAEYGLDFEGYSTQAAFFDYNKNGRLDLFLLNHSFHSQHTRGFMEQLRERDDPKAGDRLYRNEGGRFTDVTKEAGIISSALGYGLGVAITDIDQNGFPDIYVGNDFHEDDYFYINNGDGTFTESLYNMVGHTSYSSMGNDVGDINNDGRMDIISVDMMASDHFGYMSSAGPDLKPIYEAYRSFGYGEQNHRNTLQINQGLHLELPLFSETAFTSGVARTEWSWSPLFADFNNNTFNDLFITNGLPHRPTDLDAIQFINENRQWYREEELKELDYRIIDQMPEVHSPNYMYRNNGDLTFTDVSLEWGFSTPFYSNGAAYADLNGNGRLDIVANNINSPALVYQNQIPENHISNFLKVSLKSNSANSTGIGSKVFLYLDEQVLYREQMPTRGFQSSVDHVLHFGLDSHEMIDSLLVIWPDDQYQVLYQPEINQRLELIDEDASGIFDYSSLKSKASEGLLSEISDEIRFDFSHIENQFDDVNREPLMPYKLSTMGPAIAVGDVNGDGLEDIFIGGSVGYSSELFIQQESGEFIKSTQPEFDMDKDREDVDAIFFDANGNGWNDLYVVSGGNQHSEGDDKLLDRLYLNDGNGTFEKAELNLPDLRVNGSVVIAADINGNGHIDLFVGGHSIPWRYGINPQSAILENDGNGKFSDVTEQVAPELKYIGNLTSADWVFEKEGQFPDLVVAGEWMPVTYFKNSKGTFKQRSFDQSFPKLNGLWQAVHVTDIEKNGHPDIILGNFGLNSRLQVSQDSPIKMYVNDFDGNGQTAPIFSYFENNSEKPFDQLDELKLQLPYILDKAESYAEYASFDLADLIDKKKLDESVIKELNELRSLVLFGEGNGVYTVKILPTEVQTFPVKAIAAMDINLNGRKEIIMGGNLYDVKPSMGGRQDAGLGVLLSVNSQREFKAHSFQESGLLIKGQTRSIQEIALGERENGIVVARNNDKPLFFVVN
ncbi:MAG: VCBS repeat-containing protein [Balneolaceae bacterium]